VARDTPSKYLPKKYQEDGDISIVPIACDTRKLADVSMGPAPKPSGLAALDFTIYIVYMITEGLIVSKQHLLSEVQNRRYWTASIT
jgi:hypothetical protein